MVVDTITGALSVTLDDAVLSVYREWVRRWRSDKSSERMTFSEFLSSRVDEYVQHDRPAVHGDPAVPVSAQKREWLDLIGLLELAALDFVDVTKTRTGLLIIRRLVIIHYSGRPLTVAALTDGDLHRADPWELRAYTLQEKGLPMSNRSDTCTGRCCTGPDTRTAAAMGTSVDRRTAAATAGGAADQPTTYLQPRPQQQPQEQQQKQYLPLQHRRPTNP